MTPLRFRPRAIDALKNYDGSKFLADLAAGITVGAVALPLAMAFAIASGLRPEAGIFTAVIAGFLISALGGSSVQIGGPAGAFIVVVYGIVARYGVANLLLATMFAGVLLFAMGLLRLGNLVRYVPVAIVIGFTNGIAVLIALSQVPEFFGMRMGDVPAEFFAKIAALLQHTDTVNLKALLLALASLALVVGWPSVTGWLTRRLPRLHGVNRIPGTIVSLVLGTAAVALLHLEVETIGSRFGGIPSGLPSFDLPSFEWSTVQFLFAPTLTIALLGAIESLLCARVADSLTDERHDPNQELMGQGIANFVAPLFGGYCATGTIARTVTNIRSGAQSPVAGMIHALSILLVIVLAAPLAQDIPLATLAAILMFVAWNMGEWREFVRLKNYSMNYRTILLTTFALTVVFDLTVAVEVGLVLACIFFIVRMAGLTHLESIEVPASLDTRGLRFEAYRIVGSLFFGSVGKLEQLLEPSHGQVDAVILDMSQMINLDTTGMETLATLHHSLTKHGCRLLVCSVGKQPHSLMRRSGFLSLLGSDYVSGSIDDAWAAAMTAVAVPSDRATT